MTTLAAGEAAAEEDEDAARGEWREAGELGLRSNPRGEPGRDPGGDDAAVALGASGLVHEVGDRVRLLRRRRAEVVGGALGERHVRVRVRVVPLEIVRRLSLIHI